jgi:glycine dehydrogenase subunit 2
MMLIFEKSHYSSDEWLDKKPVSDIPENLLRHTAPKLPRVGELEVVRHYTRLSQKNFSIDTHFYPLGSCTMKYNPRAAHKLASLQGFTGRHPFARLSKSQGLMSCLYELQAILMELTGMKGASLSPMAGAQGEFAGVAMIKAYHEAHHDTQRCEIIVPDAAHGTNPATAAMCGYQVKEIPTNKEGDIDLEALQKALSPKTAGIMLTNPSTFGVFERQIKQIADMVHEAGGLLYYDGANLNAIMGKVRPGDMGFDVMHMNLHKTFATPHGGGGPGAGPVLVGERLVPFLPVPFVGKHAEKNEYYWITEQELPTSIGRLSGFMGNAGILVRAYIYARMLGKEGLTKASEIAVLNANYIMKRLQQAGFTLAFPNRRATHEFIVTLQPEYKKYGFSALDVAKSLLDYGIHAPTMYFPLMVPECLLIEPTETESKYELDRFVEAMTEIRQKGMSDPQSLKQAPITQPVRRMDDVKAAKELDIVWQA